MLVETVRLGRTIRLVPYSGIQFVEYAFNVDQVGRLSRRFVERELAEQEWQGGERTYRLVPAWSEDDGLEPSEEPAVASDREYTISERTGLEVFLGKWVPVPMFRIKSRSDDQEELDLGPTNWARVRVTADPARSPDSPVSHRVVFAFDTELLERRANQPYTGPSPDDASNDHEFRFAFRFPEIAWFLGASRTARSEPATAFQAWVATWIDELFKEFKQAQRPGRPLPELTNVLEPFARYLVFLEYLHRAVAPRNVRLIDSVSADPAIKPVTVDLVLDIGNSRTCGILIESFPNQADVDLNDSLVLQLRDLSEPEKAYSEPFESHVELSQASFGRDNLSRLSTRNRAFFWPSPVRVGPEAARFRELAHGNEAMSGLSSPKRYLCDTRALDQPWGFPHRDYGRDGIPPLIERATRVFLNAKGDVIQQLKRDAKQFGFRTRADDELSAARLTFSRSSFFTLLVCEVVCQALNMINNVAVRERKKLKDSPRKLRRVILTLPPAMPVQEQRLMRSRAEGAVRLLWQLMGWAENPPPGLRQPEVQVSWDEASCVQLVYLYGEVTQKLGGSLVNFLRLVGRERPFAEPEQVPREGARAEPSVRIASIDVGGGTTDLMITTYYADDVAIKPVQNFREGFRFAGDDILKGVIERLVLPGIAAGLAVSGHPHPRGFLVERFEGNWAGMPQQQQHLRRQFVLRVLQPIALRILSDAEFVTPLEEETRPVRAFREFFGSGEGRQALPADRILDYLEARARAEGAPEFKLENCSFPTDFNVVRQVVTAVLDGAFDNLAEAVHEFDCDVVLLSGRPSRLPAVVDLIVNKLAVPPNRIVPMHQYQTGNWYPFRSRDKRRIGDPKTTTVVGGMLCALAEKQITGFKLLTERLGLRSTAKFVGELDLDGRLLDDKVLFSDVDLDANPNGHDQSGTLRYWAPMRLGFRQLPIERWIATPLYHLRMPPETDAKLPIEITIEREADSFVDEDTPDALLKTESMKEDFKIAGAFDANGNALKKGEIELVLDTLPSQQGYWLDTGILSVAWIG